MASSRDRLLAKLIIFVTLTTVGVAALWMLEVVPAQHFRETAVEIDGRVTATTCGNHGAVVYAYGVGDRTYSGTDQPTSACEAVTSGDPVSVWYSPEAPEHSDLAPGENLNDAISLAIGVPIFFSAVAVLNLVWSERRRRREKDNDTKLTSLNRQ
jgi:hypothetical protein